MLGISNQSKNKASRDKSTNKISMANCEFESCKVWINCEITNFSLLKQFNT